MNKLRLALVLTVILLLLLATFNYGLYEGSQEQAVAKAPSFPEGGDYSDLYWIQEPLEPMEGTRTELIDRIYDNQPLESWVSDWWKPAYIQDVFPIVAFDYPNESVGSVPVFYYPTYELTQEYIESILDFFFPEVDMGGMVVDLDPIDENASNESIMFIPPILEPDYVLVMNTTAEFRIYSHGGIKYRRLPLDEWNDDPGWVQPDDEAFDIADDKAREFLIDHGGIPPGPSTRYLGWGANGLISISWARKIGDIPIKGPWDRYSVSVEVDTDSREVCSFSWHWPPLSFATELKDVPPLKDVAEHFGFETELHVYPGPFREVVKSYDLVYLMPPYMDPSFNASSDGYHYIAPYWVLHTVGLNSPTYYIPFHPPGLIYDLS